MISQIIDKYLRKYHKIKTWQIYGNKTKYHFLDNPQISVDGEETHGVPSVEVYDDTAKLSIGRYCSIAAECKIILGGNHHTRWASTYAFYQEPQFFPRFTALGQTHSVRMAMLVSGTMYG